MYVPTVINAKTIQDAWFRLIYDIFDNSYIQDIQRGSFEEVDFRHQYAGVSIAIELPWLDKLPIIPEGLLDADGHRIPNPTSQEYVDGYFARYIMSTELSENETYTYGERINEEIPKTVLVEGELVEGIHYKQGAQIRTQLSSVIDMLKETPLTNHAVIEIAQPKDIICCVGKDGKNDPPCLRVIDFKVIPTLIKDEEITTEILEQSDVIVIDNKVYKLVLTVSTYWRSWDLWAGLPSNLGAIELLKQYVAQECGLENGPMYAYSAGLHLYGYQETVARIRIAKLKVEKTDAEQLESGETCIGDYDISTSRD